MTDTPRRLFLAIGALAVIWIVTYWLYEPTPPPVTYGARPASLTERDLRPDPGVRLNAPVPPVVSAMRRQAAATSTHGPAIESAPAPAATPGSVVEPPPTTPATPARRVREYTIATGDVSWEAIAQRVLGDRRRGIDIAKENPLVDPTRLVPGRTVVRVPIDRERPVPEVVVPKPPVMAAATPARPPAPPAERTYTIESGDTLSGIAKDVYGQSSQWTAIFEANRDKIPNPNRLPLGVTIRIPAKAGG